LMIPLFPWLSRGLISLTPPTVTAVLSHKSYQLCHSFLHYILDHPDLT
jgi:hypothetical protein